MNCNFSGWTKKTGDLSGVVNQIDADKPAVLHVVNNSSWGTAGNQHYVLVVGYKNVSGRGHHGNLIVLDPWDGKQITASTRYNRHSDGRYYVTNKKIHTCSYTKEVNAAYSSKAPDNDVYHNCTYQKACSCGKISGTKYTGLTSCTWKWVGLTYQCSVCGKECTHDQGKRGEFVPKHNANLYSDTGLAKVVGTIPEKTVVNVSKIESNGKKWYAAVSYGGKSGYIAVSDFRPNGNAGVHNCVDGECLDCGDGTYAFRSKISNLYLSVESGSTSSGSQLVQYTPNGRGAQRFVLEKVDLSGGRALSEYDTEITGLDENGYCYTGSAVEPVPAVRKLVWCADSLRVPKSGAGTQTGTNSYTHASLSQPVVEGRKTYVVEVDRITALAGSFGQACVVAYDPKSGSELSSTCCFDVGEGRQSAIVEPEGDGILVFYCATKDAGLGCASLYRGIRVNEVLDKDDYVLSYENNVEAGTATVIATGAGDYSGSVNGVFGIVDPKDLFAYKILKGKVTITGLKTSEISNVVVPSEIEGCPVASIGDSAFKGCNSLVSVKIPSSVRSIGKEAFVDMADPSEIIVSTRSQHHLLDGNDDYITSSKTKVTLVDSGEGSGSGSASPLARIAGDYANQTSALVSAEAFGDGECGSVVLARDDDFRDAMSAAGLAGALNCPILLTSCDGLSEASGGLVRIGGQDGYETSKLIADYMVSRGLLDAASVVVASGALQAKGLDALAGAALAGRLSAPVLLANGQAAFGAVDASAVEGFLAKHDVEKAYVLGGAYVLPSAVYDAVADVWGLPHEAA